MIISPHSVRGFGGNRWPNFTASEFACNHCGEFFYDEKFFDAVQALRSSLGRAVNINSGHRCEFYNAVIGGAPLSGHLKLAVDLDLYGHDRRNINGAAKQSGFTGFGYYQTFLHLDQERKRHWFGGKISERKWHFLRQ